MNIDLSKYRKPKYLCKTISNDELDILNGSDSDFISLYKQKYIQALAKYNLWFKLADISDIEELIPLINDCYEESGMPTNVTFFELYKCITYGHGMLICNEKGHIMGSIFHVQYSTRGNSALGTRFTLHPNIRGKGLGLVLLSYSALIAMESGSKLQRGLIGHSNFSSVNNQLNHMGWFFDTFHQYKNWEPSFDEFMILSPKGFILNRLDKYKVADFIQSHNNGTDYQLVAYNDLDRIQKMYIEDDFRIIAYVKPKVGRNDHSFLAIPFEQIIEK